MLASEIYNVYICIFRTITALPFSGQCSGNPEVVCSILHPWDQNFSRG